MFSSDKFTAFRAITFNRCKNDWKPGPNLFPRYMITNTSHFLHPIIFEPKHEKTCSCHMRTTEVQISLHIHAVWSAPSLFAAHPCSLISTFVVHCLDSIMSLVSVFGNFMPLACFCSCADQFESYLIENPEDRFSRDEFHLKSSFDKQNLTLVAILFEIYETCQRLVSLISYEMTTV